ncbi:MAG: bifunctional DNA primase/polymerase, partial [Pseudomonadota bacterium]
MHELGKRPVHKDWTNRPHDNDEALARMARGEGNVGVRLTSTDLVIDFDPRNDSGRYPTGDHDEFMLWHGLDPTDWPTVRTGSGGLHYYLKKPADLHVLDAPKDFPAIEFKTRGRQVVAPGSVHPKGRTYRWIELPDDLWLEGAPQAPDALIEAARRPDRARSTTLPGGGVYGPEELATMLEALKPEDYREHSDWLELMMACHHA